MNGPIEELLPWDATTESVAELVARVSEQAEQIGALQGEVERSTAERTRAIERAKQAWESTFDAIVDPLAIIGDDLRVLRANRAWAAASRLPIQQVPGARCHEVLFRSGEPCSGCPLPLLAGDSPATGRVRHDGRIWRVWAYPAQSPEGEMLRICQYKDVTDETALARRMAQSEKMAALGQFAAGIAHEINNPLSAIIAFAQLLRRGESAPGEMGDFAHEIEHSAKRCRHILRGLLDFARPASGSRSRIDLRQVVEKSLLLTGHDFKPPQFRLDVKLPDAPVHVTGSTSDLQGVLVNLIVNARAAMPNGGRLSVRLELEPPLARLTVGDTGCGMATDVVARIFDPFFTTKPEGEGTGLGLAICREVVEAHDGYIDCCSVHGEGTDFTVLFPLAEDRA